MKSASISSSATTEKGTPTRTNSLLERQVVAATTEQQSAANDFRSGEESDSKEQSDVALPPSLMKAIRRRSSSILGSTSSNAGSGNNSDNSGLVSIGNNSFGFNFDSEEGMKNSDSNSDGDVKTNESDSGEDSSPVEPKNGGAMTADSTRGSEMSVRRPDNKSQAVTGVVSSGESGASSKGDASLGSGSDCNSSSVSSLTQPPSSSDDTTRKLDKDSHHAAAAAAVANLHSIASRHSPKEQNSEDQKPAVKLNAQALQSLPTSTGKRPARDSEEQDTGGYNSEADGTQAVSSRRPATTNGGPSAAINVAAVATSSSQQPVPTQPYSNPNVESVAASDAATVQQRGRTCRKKAKKLDDSKREERNAREKERSFRISKQINELRNLLSSGGVIVPKGTKSSVLTEAANYIRMLQQHQYRSEIDRHQLVQQMQMIGGGALGTQAANAVRHVAAQNGVWSLGNFGGVPPKSAMTYYPETQEAKPDVATSQGAVDPPISATVQEHDYRYIFNSSPVGMAVASMGGAFIDCNQLFCQLSNYSKQEVCSMTIFNLTSRQDLQHAFDLISQMISPPSDATPTTERPKPCVLRGSMKNRNDLGLSVGLIRGDDGIAKCFCVTLIKNPSSPFDPSRPTPATADFILPPVMPSAKGGISSAPAYTTG